MKSKRRVLGLDIGIASVGWAYIDMASKEVVGMGVHLWSAPQNPKTGESLAAARGASRRATRNTRRRRDRARHCLQLLKDHGLVPQDATGKWMQTVKGDPQPLQSRVDALDGRIGDRHLAQALYNICARRGYIPHGQDDASDTEGRKVLSALEANEAEMESGRCRTVGEMMLKRGESQGVQAGRSRNKAGDYTCCVRMSQLVDEARAIFAAQRSFGNPAATRELEDAYVECLTWEKSSADHDERVYRLVAPCVYFGDRNLKAAARACLSFEMCTAYERLNHTRVIGPGGAEAPLPPHVVARCIDVLFSPSPVKNNKACKVTYKALRRMADLSAAQMFKGVEAKDEARTEPCCPKVWRAQREALPAELMGHMRADVELADAIDGALAYASSEDSLRARLAPLGLAAEHVEALCALPFTSRAYSGYGTRSPEALSMLVDAFEAVDEVHSLADAELSAGLAAKRAASPAKSRHLPPYKVYDPTCSNPVVLRVMARVRKLVNAAIDEYGMPDEIHIELARDLKRSKRERDAISRSNKARQRARDAARERLAAARGVAPEQVSGKLLRKYELWAEQRETDLYQGAHISYERMLNDPSYCQIDHILPYSRTCDDSQSNKVLVLSSSNQEKSSLSPYEWLEPQGRWPEFAARVAAACQAGYPQKKARKLLETDLPAHEEGFTERNMNDTRYACRAARGYIEAYLALPDDGRRHVYAVAGGATSAMRSAWGFAGKDRRADDCHHAADAAIVAACDAGTVQRIARASERRHTVPKERRDGLLAGTEPWEGFALAVERRCMEVVPTRRVDGGGTGRLFEETVYSYVGEQGGKALLKASGKTSAAGNYVLRPDGSAVKPAGMAFLRLWWWEEKGRWLLEPVYYCDLLAIARKDYTPRYIKAGLSRDKWPQVPPSALALPPVELRYGTCFELDGELMRFKSCDAANGSITVAPDMRRWAKRDGEKGRRITIGKRADRSSLRVVEEDILGLCFSSAR